MFFARENKKKNKNKNRQKTIRPIRIAYDYFLRERNDAFDKKPQRCVSFAPKFPPFIGACGLHALLFRSYFADIQGEKIFSQISSLRKVRSISKIGVDSFVYFTVDEQRKGKKTEWDVSLSCTFLLALFCLLFKPGILLKFIHFQLYIQNKKLTLFVIPGLPNILTLIIYCTIRF